MVAVVMIREVFGTMAGSITLFIILPFYPFHRSVH